MRQGKPLGKGPDSMAQRMNLPAGVPGSNPSSGSQVEAGDTGEHPTECWFTCVFGLIQCGNSLCSWSCVCAPLMLPKSLGLALPPHDAVPSGLCHPEAACSL